MLWNQPSFEEMLGLLRQVSDDELEDAIEIVRRYGAGADLRGFPQRLVLIVKQLGRENQKWVESVLCVRAQQTGREHSWLRFASSSYWELTSSYAPHGEQRVDHGGPSGEAR